MATLLLFLPMLGSPLLHLPVLRFDWLRALKRPIDGGRTVRGRRLLGDNKTWRGALVMFAGVVLATLALWQWPSYLARVPLPVRAAGPLVCGALLGAGMVLGELPNSFLKRQLGIAPGARGRSVGGVLWSLFDQGDFVPVVWLLLAPIWVMPPAEVVLAFVVIVAIHLVLNLVGFALGARRTRI